MVKDDLRSNQLTLTVMALVAVVAIVGLVALVINVSPGSPTEFATGNEMVSAADYPPTETNEVGNALSRKGYCTGCKP